MTFNFRSQHLKEHILRHSKSDVKNFTCPISDCDSRFSSRNLVYRHVKKVHRQDKRPDPEVSNILCCNEFDMKSSTDVLAQPNLNDNPVSQLDTVTLLSGNNFKTSLVLIDSLETR